MSSFAPDNSGKSRKNEIDIHDYSTWGRQSEGFLPCHAYTRTHGQQQ